MFNAIKSIRDAPRRWPEYIYKTRRFVLDRFPYSIIYLDTPELVAIIAIAHSERKPATGSAVSKLKNANSPEFLRGRSRELINRPVKRKILCSRDSEPWSGEMGPGTADPGQDPRGAPDIDPLWTILDLIPEGRGADFYPKLD